MTEQILTLFPEQLDVNGDSQNATVLAQRARWAGLDVAVQTLPLGAPAPDASPAAVVIGSSVDAELHAVREGLAALAPALRRWVDAGVPLLAVGTGLELLSSGLRLDDAREIEGLGLLPGRAEPLPARAAEDLVVSSRFGRLIGYENHARGLRGIRAAEALGTVAAGVGNDRTTEGVIVGSAIGTHLHGPVLAKNPAIADWMLTTAFGERYRVTDERIRAVDDMARAARDQIAKRLGLGVDGD